MKKLALVITVTWSLSSYCQKQVDSIRTILEKKFNNETTHINALNDLAHLLRRSDPVNSLTYSQEALKLSKDNKFRKGESDANTNIGLYYWLKSSLEKSFKYGLAALEISDSIDYKKGKMEAYLLLSLVYNQLKEFEKVEKYSNNALAIALSLKDSEGIARAYNSIGLLHRKRKDDEGAFHYFQMGLSYLENDNNFPIKIALLGNAAHYYLTKDEERVKTRLLLEEGLRIAITLKDKYGESLIRMRMGILFKDLAELNKAEEQFSIIERSGNFETYTLLDTYIYLIDINTKLGKNNEAHQYQVKYSKTRDSLFNLERANKIAQLEILYQTEKREHTIQLLEQDSLVQATWKKVLIAGVLMTITSAYIIYRLQRSRVQKAKQLLEVQQVLNNKLSEINQLNSKFFANISHEFRTPLTLILAPIEEIQKNKSLSEKEKELLSLMNRNANRMLDLINQLLDLSKLEAGKMNLSVKPGNIESFIKVIASSFDTWATNKQIQFIKNIKVEDKVVWYDDDKVEKIITNLLSNAFKFTPNKGTVTLSALVNERDSKKIITLTISDTGKGIREGEQTQIFSPFYQSKLTAGFGTGLGLSLVKELVNLYKGNVSFQSTVGTGTTFLIELPASREAFTSEQILEPDEIGLVRSQYPNVAKDYIERVEDLEEGYISHFNEKDSVLIVEDNADLRNFIASLLSDKYSVLTANDGEEAFEITQRLVPNLVLSDLLMPKIDGLHLTEKIKGDEKTSHIPVILLTAKNEQQARLDALSLGAEDFIPKPFLAEELLARINNLINQRKLLIDKFRERSSESIESSEISADDEFIKRLITVVESHSYDNVFTTKRLANEMKLSKEQLFHRLKSITGLSPHEFINNLKSHPNVIDN